MTLVSPRVKLIVQRKDFGSEILVWNGLFDIAAAIEMVVGSCKIKLQYICMLFLKGGKTFV